MSQMTYLIDGYLEAVYFTETGDVDQPPASATLSPYFLSQAHIDCRNFFWAVTEGPALDGWVHLDWHLIGHDLWLTRNGHGTGFWDRPEIYGEGNAVLFTRIARAMGAHYADFGAQE